jgi:GTP-binding protein
MLPVDIRRGLIALDSQLLEWCTYNDLPVHVLLTKSDKLSRSSANNVLLETRRELHNELITVQLFSALRKLGIEEARKQVLALLDRPD